VQRVRRLADGRDRSWQTRTATPDGSFALIPIDAQRIELLADFLASRMIWIAKTDDVFVASMSQRAVPWFLQSFKPNRRAILWMLSSRSLGPCQPWDRRAQPLGPGASRLDRMGWNLQVEEPPVMCCVDPNEDEVHRCGFCAAMDVTCVGLDEVTPSFAAEANILVFFADTRAVTKPDDAFAHPSVAEILLDEISSDRTGEILPAAIESFVAERLTESSGHRGASTRKAALKRALKCLLPTRLRAALARKPGRCTLSARRLALRTYLITRLTERLRRDARTIH